MNLAKKKMLAARTFGVGKARIFFVQSRIEEIKEAITKQDIRDLNASGAIIVKNIKGRRKVTKRTSRSQGNIRKKVNVRKKNYVIMVRNQRRYGAEMLRQGKITKEELKDLRKKIRNKVFKSKASLKDYIGGTKK